MLSVKHSLDLGEKWHCIGHELLKMLDINLHVQM